MWCFHWRITIAKIKKKKEKEVETNRKKKSFKKTDKQDAIHTEDSTDKTLNNMFKT